MKKTIETKRTAHYYLQVPSKPVDQILFVIHGYAQLASEFIQEFSFLKDSNTLVLAPEALSKFYNKERKPVANWMTSHEREDDIKDYVYYLKKIEEELFRQYPNAKKRVLGFSQGVSTLFRWSVQSNFKTEIVYVCSGSIPPELNKAAVAAINSSTIIYYYGNNDGLLSLENAKKQIDFLEKLGLTIIPKVFDGRHEISAITKADLI